MTHKNGTLDISTKIKKKKTGSSIVETVVALALFAIFIGGACKVIFSQRQLADKARSHYSAINIAKNRIEQVRNMRRADYTQIIAMIEPGTRVNSDGDPAPDNGKFLRKTEINTTGTTDLLEISVTVKIQNPINLEFQTEKQYVSSYMAKLNTKSP